MAVSYERCGECDRCMAPQDEDTVSCLYWLLVDYLKSMAKERAENA